MEPIPPKNAHQKYIYSSHRKSTIKQFSHTHKEVIITATDLADDLLDTQSCKKDLHVTGNQAGKEKNTSIRMGPMHLGEICKEEKAHRGRSSSQGTCRVRWGGRRSLVSTHKQ